MNNQYENKQTKIKEMKSIAMLITLAFCMCILFSNPAHATTMYEVGVKVTFGQTEAREMLQLVNELRTGTDAWYWNSDDATKTVCSNLGELTYDYQLEAAAMQRAAEIAIYYSHTRPNGERCFTVYDDLGYAISVAGENIAAGYRTGEAVFEGWKEENENYAGQGHRRNMLNANFTAIGIGHVYYNGYHYWVQQLGTASTVSETPANDSETLMKVNIADSEIESITLSEGTNTVKCGETISLSGYKTFVKLAETWPGNAGEVDTDIAWNLPENAYAKYENGQITGLKAGKVNLTATVMGRQNNIEFTVQHKSKTVVQQATIHQEGGIREVCEGCGAVISESKIPAIQEIGFASDEFVYKGTAIEPFVIVKDTTGTVVSNENYTVTYTNNISVGTGMVTIAFHSNQYSGTTSKTFEITPAELQELFISDEIFVYDGTEKKPAVTVKNDTSLLVENTDYRVSYSDNTNVGTAIVQVAGMGNYTGTLTKTFAIEPKNITEVLFKEDRVYVYDGTEQIPEIVVKSDETVLDANAYVLTYMNNINAGIATVIVNGIGNYTGTLEETFIINPAAITDISISAEAYLCDGQEKKPTVTVNFGTKNLMDGIDYIVAYQNNINPGTATVTVTGKGNYIGNVSKIFKINLSKVANFKQSTTYATTKISMSWNKVKGADGYAIYRAGTKNGYYKYLKSVTTNTASHAGLKAGSKYYYKVRAYKNVNGIKLYGAYSDAKSMLTKPAAPTGFTVALKSRTAKISWSKVTGVQGYEVYMSNSRNGSYTRIKNAGTSTTSYNKTGLTKGKKYYFKMRAYTKTGTGTKLYSGCSKIKAVTVK